MPRDSPAGLQYAGPSGGLGLQLALLGALFFDSSVGTPLSVRRGLPSLKAFALDQPAACRWRLWLGWQCHLRRLHAGLQVLQPRLVAALALQRWLAAVAAAQADDGATCHRALQLPRVFTAWQQRAARGQELRLQGEWCQRLLACRRRRNALLAWRQWAAGRQDARERVCQMAARRAFLRQQTVLAAWKSHARLKAVQHEQRLQAAEQRAALLRRLALQRWRRWAGLRHAGGRWRRRYVLERAFASWRQRAAGKARQTERWRVAVQHRCLRMLWSGLQGLRQHQQKQRQKQHVLQGMRQCYQASLLRLCLQAWGGPFMTAARQQHAKQQAALARAQRLALAPVLKAWRVPWLAAARQRRTMLQAADSHRTAALLISSWRGWLEWQERQEGKRQHLAAAQALLRPRRLRRMLAAWRSWHARAVLQGRQVGLRVWAVLPLVVRCTFGL